MELYSVLTCPECGQAERLAMPTNACVFFHECASCHALLRPRGRDCCVFCSFGSVQCPPRQTGCGCCAPDAAVVSLTSDGPPVRAAGPTAGRWLTVADAAGALGAIAAALCCAGTPIIVGALTAVGLSFLRRDSILWPVMLLSLGVALRGYWQGWRMHRHAGPLVVGSVGAIFLAAGVIVVHGPPAMQMIYRGAVLLVVATAMNIIARRAAHVAA